MVPNSSPMPVPMPVGVSINAATAGNMLVVRVAATCARTWSITALAKPTKVSSS